MGKDELITNPFREDRQTVMTPTRRESLLIKVKGDQLSRWFQQILGEIGCLMVYALIAHIFRAKCKTDKQDRSLLINLRTFKAADKE